MRRRVLLLNTDLEIGGTPTVVRELAMRLHAPHAGVEVEVACLSPWGPMADHIRRLGVGVTAFDADDVFDLPFVVRRLVRLIRSRGIDTVLSFLVHGNAVAALASRFCRDVRFVQSIQTTQPRPRWHWWLQSMVQDAAELIVVPSPSVAQAAQDRANIPPEKIVVIPNAIEAAELQTAPPPAADEPDAAFEVVFIGRLDPVKRIPDLIGAINRLRDHNIRLSIYGDGAQRAELRERIDEQHLRDHVTLQGTIPAREALAASDLLVLPSEAEGFGLVLIEAMAAGVAIVATNAPGIRDVVEHERTAVMVPVGDIEALAAAIQRCMDDPALRQRLIERGRSEVAEKYAWSRILPQYHRVLGITRSGSEPG